MRILMLYEYPPPPAGLATQGDLLFRGLTELGVDCMPAPQTGNLQKEWVYRQYKPHIAIGVGFWGQLPELVIHPREHGVYPVPWLVADGWVANYHKELNALPLILATSQWVKETYIRDGISGDLIVVQPIGCDVQSFRPIPMDDPKVRAVREVLGVADDEKLILTIGGDGASKGSREMMAALAKIDGEFSKWRYVVKVWNSERTAKQNALDLELAEELGISHKVHYVIDGPASREFMPYLYNACDIYAAPSRLEGFGMPHVEAQSCGKPVLSIDAMGIKETVIHGETGFLARPAKWISITESEVGPESGYAETKIVKFDEPKVVGVRADVDDLAEYLVRLLTDEKLDARMGVAGRAHVERTFDYRDIAKHVMNVLEDRMPQAVGGLGAFV